jgi:hypothetical protein
MIHIQSTGGRIFKFSWRLRLRRGLFKLGRWLLRLSRQPLDDTEAILTPFHLDNDSRFDEATRLRLQHAADDFDAARAGLYPLHAKEGAAFLDGGTSTWEGDGYRLTLIKSLTTVGEVHGFMYGPILELTYPLAHGNTTQISHVHFYAGAELERLLKSRR